MAIFWSNVGIDVQTALASAQAITNITKASPPVLSYSGSDPANGDYIYVAAQGMSQVNDCVFRVANVNAGSNTLELEGQDSSAFDTFVSGSMQIITFGASMSTAQNVNVSGGDPEFADLTTIHDTVRKRAPTIVSPLSFGIDAIFDPTDPAFVELNKAYKAKTKRAIRLRFGTGAKMVLTGYCAASGVPTGQAQSVVQTKMSIEAQNTPTVYSS